MTSETEQKEIKSFFEERLVNFKKLQAIYKKALIGNFKNPQSPEVWRLAAMQKPTTALSYFVYTNFIDTYEVMQSVAESVIESEFKIAKLEKDVKKIAKAKDIDVTTVKSDVAELKKDILPAVKSMVQLFDNLKKQEAQRKENGEVMVV